MSTAAAPVTDKALDADASPDRIDEAFPRDDLEPDVIDLTRWAALSTTQRAPNLV
jgi:hypothetical protein